MERKPMNYRIPSLRQQIASNGHCPVCEFHYVPEIPENRKLHRQFHAEVVRPLICKPDPRLEALGSTAGDIRVDIKSPKWLHGLIYDRARALSREEDYGTQWQEDGVPWEWDALRPNPPHAFLLIEQGNIPVGVAAFENGQFWTNIAPGWHLLFVWVAPQWRRQGVLSRRWASWRTVYQDFTVETPISESMASFLTKHNHPLDRFIAASPNWKSWANFVSPWRSQHKH
jgi:zinc-finger of acetyl-transferase ESCO